MSELADGGSSLPLLAWLSPAFPVGAFAYSHGLEWAVEAGDIADAASLESWLSDLLEHGSARSDAILLACAWRAAKAQDTSALAGINELALALAPSQERHLESMSQGNAFLVAIRAAWPCATLSGLGEATAYPVAVGAAAAGHGIALHSVVAAYALAFIGNLVSATVRLGPIGQTDGQRIVARFAPRAERLAHEVGDADLDDIGSCALRADIASLRHETQYSRLFRS